MRQALPGWLRPKQPKGPYLAKLGPRLRALGVETICENARCPNVGECFSDGNMTFLILGAVCTRNCRYCAVSSGRPEPPDPEEPARVAEAARDLELKHVVVTSVTRDDLADGGAAQFAAVVSRLRQRAPGAKIETLVPDFRGEKDSVRQVMEAKPDIFAHNLEVTRRLYPALRPGGKYEWAISVLRAARDAGNGCPTKSGLMVGLGEKEEEVLEALSDLREAGVDLLTIGQYLRPTSGHFPVKEYVEPALFGRYEEAARALGFRGVLSGPLVRSSYHAAELA
jgi:lipoic acid synthetase